MALWPFSKGRASAAFSRGALWRFLDGADVPFRASLGDLVEKHGVTPPEWRGGPESCALTDCLPVLGGMAHPLSVGVQSSSDATLPPAEFKAVLRGSNDAMRNLRSAESQLRKVFGAGVRENVSNTRGWRWGDGYCGVFARVFPPKLNRFMGINEAHQQVKGMATECVVTFRPDYWPEVTQAEREAYLAFEPGFDRRVPAAVSPLFDQLTRPRDGLPERPAGMAVVADKSLIISHLNGRFAILKPTQMREVFHEHLAPAKGAGGNAVGVRGPMGSVYLGEGRHDDASLMSFAEELAGSLVLPLTTTSYLDA